MVFSGCLSHKKMSESQLRQFYEDQHIFITGGNGFIGKTLVEKLLRSTDVAVIYLLMRRKKGKDVACRLEEMLENEPFKKLKKERPDFKNRIKIIVGDNVHADLGLSAVDYQTLISRVNVVFHVAASIRFTDNIKIAYDTNVGMTKKIISLCKQMRNLKSFIHMSTAYSNCYRNSIDEIFYDDFGLDYKKVELILDEPDGPEKLTTKILKKWPNTYSFTKAVAEILIQDTAHNLPVGIFRPSMVLSTYKEPLEGWTDSFGGPNALVAAIASGFIRFFCCDVKFVVDLVPVDMSVAALIASAWDVYQQERINSMPIYNYVSGIDNPITYHEFNHLMVSVNSDRYPFKNALWTPKLTVARKSSISKVFFEMTYHYLPALFVDLASILCFKKPSMVSKYRKFNAVRAHMEYFMANEWTFTNTNVKTMWNKMNEADKKLFPFDLTQINWLSYLRNYFKGLRHYLCKEPWNNLKIARNKANRLKLTHKLFLFIAYFVGIVTVWTWLLKTIPLKYLRLSVLRRN